MSAGVPGAAVPHQMPDGLPRSRGLELPPRVSAGVPGAAVPHQMPDGLPRSRGLEIPPHVSAGVPGAAVPHQMPDGLPRSRGLELPPRVSAGVPGAAVAYRMHYQPQRGQEPYPRMASGQQPWRGLEQYYDQMHQSMTAAVSSPVAIPSTTVPLPRTTPLSLSTPDLLRRERFDQPNQNWELPQALGTLMQQLPPLAMFSGDDSARDSGSFLDWVEQFEMVAELAQWSEGVKLRQMVLRLRGSARAFYRACLEETKRDYQTLTQELKKRFTPVRIQALESSIFRERKQKTGELVDAYAQDLQRLFQKAYPNALQGSEDARAMGRAVLSNQFIGGLLPELKRKIAYIEGATFSELWQKARFEEARLQDLARTDPKMSTPSWRQRPHRDNLPRQDERPHGEQPQSGSTRESGKVQRRSLQYVKCYNCNRMGHLAKDCHFIRQAEAPARYPSRNDPKSSTRSTETRTAAVVPVEGEYPSQEEGESLKWVYQMYGILPGSSTHDCTPRLGPTVNIPLMVDGIPLQALVDTGCPTTIISREICRKVLDEERELFPENWKERATQRVQQPSLMLRAYCGAELSIGAEIAVQVATPHRTVNTVVLVQKDTPVDMLLGTDLMSSLGIKVLDAKGQSLLHPVKEQPAEEQLGQRKEQQLTPVKEQPAEEQFGPHQEQQLTPVEEQPAKQQLAAIEEQQPTPVEEQPVLIGEQPIERLVPIEEQLVSIDEPAQVTVEKQPVRQNTTAVPEFLQGTDAVSDPQQTITATSDPSEQQRVTFTTCELPQDKTVSTLPDPKPLSPCIKLGNGRYIYPAGYRNSAPSTQTEQKPLNQKRVPVRLIRACKLPGRCGKLVKAKMQLSLSESSFDWIFEPRTRLHHCALEVADAVVIPEERCFLLPVRNSSSSPTRLRRGQLLGWIQPADVLSPTDNASGMEEAPDSETINDRSEVPKEVIIDINDNTDRKATEETDIETSSERGGEPDGTDNGRWTHLKAMLYLDQAEVEQPEREALETFLAKNADVFAVDSTELGLTNVISHSIDTGENLPIHQPPRRIPFALRSQVEEMINDMLDLDVIQPTSSPWASPIVLVKKKDGSMRFCVDYRRLNRITKLDVYPLPRIDETLDVLSGARFFTTLDLASGYWQVSMDPAAREKTAFVTHAGLYEFKVMPFGLCNAPATFQRLMEVVLTGLTRNQCFVYLDDILVISRTWNEHLENLQLVFDRLREAGLSLKPKKCTFARRKALYLGHVVSEQGIEVDTEKVEKVRNYPIPTNVKTLQRFLGLASYYRRFIPNLSKVASPLYCLTRKDAPFVWSESCQESFEKLKMLLTSTPVLAFPNFQKPFTLETDASGSGLGAVLSQHQDDNSIRPIAYASRGLQKHEQNYGISELEALAVVWATKHFHVYLYGHHCTVLTDHCALKSLLNTPHPSGKLARWGLALQELDLDIQYRPGKLHTNADVLSRLPLLLDQPITEPNQEMPNPLVARVEAVNEEPDPPTEEWQKLQRADSELHPTLTYLEDGTLPSETKAAKRLVLTSQVFFPLGWCPLPCSV